MLRNVCGVDSNHPSERPQTESVWKYVCVFLCGACAFSLVVYVVSHNYMHFDVCGMHVCVELAYEPRCSRFFNTDPETPGVSNRSTN